MMYGHGNELSLIDSDVIADFSSNISFEPVSPKLIKFLTEELLCISNYPEPEAAGLSCKLAKYHDVNDDQILVTNGSCEAFYLLARLFHDMHSCIPIPSFSEYADACMVNKHKITFIDNSSLPADFSKYDIVWIGNPNNPDGKTLPKKTVEQLCEKHANVYFIVDEAYAELCDDFESSISLINTYCNLIIIRSLTKIFSIPGLRLGYVIAHSSIINNLKKYTIPWNVNALAIKAGHFIVYNYYDILPDIASILTNSFNLQLRLDELKFIEVQASKCNFFLVRLLKGTSDELKKYLLDTDGLLIRDASNFKGLDNTWIRLATQNETNNELLYNGLKRWMQL